VRHHTRPFGIKNDFGFSLELSALWEIGLPLSSVFVEVDRMLLLSIGRIRSERRAPPGTESSRSWQEFKQSKRQVGSRQKKVFFMEGIC